jgi:hypothetical protein
MAEIELNVITNHGLPERIPGIEHTRKEAGAWSRKRSREACKINWRFISAAVRVKLKHLRLSQNFSFGKVALNPAVLQG